MTIQDFSASSSSAAAFGSKNNSLLGLLLKAPIAKKTMDFKKSPFARNLNQQRLQSSMDLVNVTKYHQRPCVKVPINSGHHKIDWQWQSASNKSSTIYSTDKRTVLFHAECESCFETDATRGNRPLKKNAFTYWEISLLNNQINGTSIQIGIGNDKARLNSLGYLNILGSDANSYGLTHNGKLWHKNESRNFCAAWNEPQVTIGCLFNGYTGQLSYYKNGILLGVAFDNINMSEPLYPMISSTVAQSAFRLTLACETFPSLRDLCRKTIVAEAVNLEQERLPESVLAFLKN